MTRLRATPPALGRSRPHAQPSSPTGRQAAACACRFQPSRRCAPPARAAQAAVPHLPTDGTGCVINTTSITAYMGARVCVYGRAACCVPRVVPNPTARALLPRQARPTCLTTLPPRCARVEVLVYVYGATRDTHTRVCVGARTHTGVARHCSLAHATRLAQRCACGATPLPRVAAGPRRRPWQPALPR
jgi:hypothetical protein